MSERRVLAVSDIAGSRSSHTCHASTAVAVSSGLLVAYFAGTAEGNPDVGIWLSRRQGCAWSTPRKVADGRSSDGACYPCWNPVLHALADGSLLLFYKVGLNCAHWWGMLRRSADEGATWSAAERLPHAIWGPIRNKPIELPDGRLLCPSSTEHLGWRVHLEWTSDAGRTWQRSAVVRDPSNLQAIQPTLLRHPDGRLQMLCRSRAGRIATSWSHDQGASWAPLLALDLPNPNSAVDAIALPDGRFLLAYNHSAPARGQWGGPRTPLCLAESSDGIRWQRAATLEDAPGEFSYPALVAGRAGRIHLTYTWQRAHIRVLTLDPA